MDKKYISPKALIFSILLLTSCGPSLQKRMSTYTHNPLQESYKLNNGMSKQEVLSIMGKPVKDDFYKNVDEWFYCNTGVGGDQHLAVYFYEGKLIAKKNYVVTVQDVNGQTGSCEWFIKRGNYREPDVVTEIRLKN